MISVVWLDTSSLPGCITSPRCSILGVNNMFFFNFKVTPATLCRPRTRLVQLLCSCGNRKT